MEHVVALASEAIEAIDKRTAMIELEKESIEASKEEFSKIKVLIDELVDQDVKQEAITMYEVMDKRYASYNTLYKAYTNSLEQEKELYAMLQQADLEQEVLTKQINLINESYQQILEENAKFNEYTVEYNALKKEFYQLSGINVMFEAE